MKITSEQAQKKAQLILNDPTLQAFLANIQADAPMRMGLGRGNWDAEGDVAAMVRACTREDNSLDEGQLCRQGAYWMETLHQAYAATVGAMAAERDTRTNNAVTLSGPSVALGATYAGGVPIALSVRTANGIAGAAGLNLSTWMQLYRLFVDPADSIAGWKFVGGSVLISTDPAASFNLGDVAFTAMRSEVPRLETPLAWMYDRRPITQTTLQMQVIHYGAAPIPLIQGVTATYLDTRCPDLYTWAGGPRDQGTIFPLVVNQVLATARNLMA